MKQIEFALNVYAFNPEIRWQVSETEDNLPGFTALLDHTFCQMNTKDPFYRSGKHDKHGVKYLVLTTLQGTIINVVGPFPGSRHDFRCMKTSVINGSPVPHYVNDKWLADSGYQGANAVHVLVPWKRDQNCEELLPMHAKTNEIIQRFRARIEHTFGCTKNRFFLFGMKSRLKSADKHGQLFKLACLGQNILQQAANRVYKKYDSCFNKQIVHGRRLRKVVRGNACPCLIFPTSDENSIVSKPKSYRKTKFYWNDRKYANM